MIIQSKKVWIADQFIPAQLELEDGIIKEIYPYNEKEVTKDYGDLRILPGFIDIHCHGAYGFDTNDADPEGLRKWAKGIVDEGVTSFLATTLTQSEEVLTNAVSNVAKVVEEGYEGAEILGIHFEGPYLNKAHKGAQPEEYCVKPDIEQFKRYQKAAHGLIKYITMAVENDEDYALTKYCSQNNVVVSIGHSNATYEQAVQAYAHGARSMTHVYNAMTPLTHRNPGVVGAIMEHDEVYAELILDGIHVSYPAAKVLLRAKGLDKVILITDSIEASGLEDGQYKLGNQAVFVKDNSARLEDGTLAGSILAMNNAVKNAYQHLGLSINEAVNLASYNPAKNLNLINLGEIAVNKTADIIMFDEEINVDFVMIDGNVKIGG